MRVVMMGTGPFGVPTLRALYDSPHAVAALVAAPLRTHRGKQIAPPSGLREIAAERGTPVFDPEDVNTAEAQARLSDLAADLLVVCDYGQILRPATLATARLGGINLHGSLLPKYRGASPINWAVYHGEPETGVSVIHMTPQVDAGPVIAQARAPIEPDETALELESRLAELGAPLVIEAIGRLNSGAARPLAQDPALASKAPRLKKTDGLVDWSRTAEAIRNQRRAMEPWPGTYTFWRRRDAPPVRLILGRLSVIDVSGPKVPPGTVLEADAGRLVVAAGRGALLLHAMQPAGKRMMDAEEFLRGHHVRPGDRMGTEDG